VSQILLVFRHEVYTLVSRASFWIATLAVPLIAFTVYAGAAYLNQIPAGTSGQIAPFPTDGNGGDASGAEGDIQAPSLLDSFRRETVQGLQGLFTPPTGEAAPRGYVDLDGILHSVPEMLDTDRWIQFAGEDEAAAALEAETIEAYYVIGPAYIRTGRLVIVKRAWELAGDDEALDDLTLVIHYNMLGKNPDLLAQISRPFQKILVEPVNPEQAAARNRESMAALFLPYGVMSLFFIAILGSAGLMLNSLTKEKENRTLEVLMLSASPQQILVGKMAGLGVVGLLQVVLVSVSAFSLLRTGADIFPLPEALQLDTSILFWGVLFFLAGFLLYGALMAGVGALVPGMREGSQATLIITLPMMLPFFVATGLASAPDGLAATLLSLFPYTAPTAMMLRLAATSVPLWQILLSLALQCAALVFTARLVARLFRAQTLLTGQGFHLRALWRALK
jgi:ABC-2 type transport system permease protein